MAGGPVLWRSFVSRDQLPTAQSKELYFQRSNCQDLNCQVPNGQNVRRTPLLRLSRVSTASQRTVREF